MACSQGASIAKSFDVVRREEVHLKGTGTRSYTAFGHKPPDVAGHFSAESCDKRSAGTGWPAEYPERKSYIAHKGIEGDGIRVKNRKRRRADAERNPGSKHGESVLQFV